MAQQRLIPRVKRFMYRYYALDNTPRPNSDGEYNSRAVIFPFRLKCAMLEWAVDAPCSVDKDLRDTKQSLMLKASEIRGRNINSTARYSLKLLIAPLLKACFLSLVEVNSSNKAIYPLSHRSQTSIARYLAAPCFLIVVCSITPNSSSIPSTGDGLV